MKKVLIIVFTVLFCFSFIGCSTETSDGQILEKESDEIISNIEITYENNVDSSPQIQDVRKFLTMDTPYDVDIGDYGSMDFMYSLEYGEEELIQQFIDSIVIGNYGLNLVDIETYDYDSAYCKFYHFMYRGNAEKKLQRENMDYDVSIGITTHKNENKVIAGIYYVNGFELVDDGHRADYSKVTLSDSYFESEQNSESTGTSSTSTNATDTPQHSADAGTIDINAAYIPDFTAFLKRNPSEDKDKYYGGNRKYYQSLPIDTQTAVVSEVLNLLDKDRYQLELIEKVETDNRIEYNYRYTGKQAMDSIHSKNDDTRYYNLQFTVYNKYNNKGTYSIHFHYSPQFVKENVGYTVSADVSGSGGSGGSTVDFEGRNTPDHSKLPCLTCDGDGDCTRCGGSTYVGYGDARAKCDRCRGTGDCRTCGGSGTRG